MAALNGPELGGVRAVMAARMLAFSGGVVEVPVEVLVEVPGSYPAPENIAQETLEYASSLWWMVKGIGDTWHSYLSNVATAGEGFAEPPDDFNGGIL